MNRILAPFLAFAGLGFLASLVAHLMALAGVSPPGGAAVMGLHIGVFAVWIPAVIVSIRSNLGQRNRLSWKQLLSGCPPWMFYALMALFVYAFVNFFVAIEHAPAAKSSTRALTSSTLRAFSGHWMLFYGAAFAIMLSAYRKPALLKAAHCPSGHEVARADRFCPSCGAAIPRPGSES